MQMRDELNCKPGRAARFCLQKWTSITFKKVQRNQRKMNYET